MMSVESNLSRRICPSRDQILADVKRIVAEQAGIAPEAVRESDNLINDLGCDSLDVIEIAMEVEEQFGITVPDDVSDAARTVGDIVDGVLQLLGHPVAD
jgi:acyl carrier protein